MDDSSPSRAWDDPKHRWAVYLLAIAFVTICIGFAARPVYKGFSRPFENKDYSLWYHTGQKVIQGQSLYPESPNQTFAFMYPPFPAIVLYAPLSLLGPAGMVIALALLNAAAFLGCLFLAVYLASGRFFHRELLLYLIPGLVVLPFVWDTFFLGQANILLLFLMLLCFAGLRTKRQAWAGVALAMAVAIKAFPLMAVGYLVWRRQWIALGSLAASLVLFLVLLPAPIRGLSFNLHELDLWVHGMVLKDDSKGISQRPGIAYTYRNQSLLALTHRTLRDVPADETPDGQGWFINIAHLSAGAANNVFLALAAGLCGFYVWVMPPLRQRTGPMVIYEQAMLLILMILFSPLAWTYFFCWLLLPIAGVVHFIHVAPKGSRHEIMGMTLLGGCVLILASALTQAFDFTATQAWGATTWGAIALFFTLGWMLRTQRSLAGAMA